jgi:hypothetical protein
MKEKWKWTVLGILAHTLSIAIPSLLVGLVIYYYWRKKYFQLPENFYEFIKDVLKPNLLKIILFISITFTVFLSLSYYLYADCLTKLKTIEKIAPSAKLTKQRCEFSLNPFQSGYKTDLPSYFPTYEIPFWLQVYSIMNVIFVMYLLSDVIAFYFKLYKERKS